MKRLIAAMIFGIFALSAVQATSNTDYSKWTTAQLQQKRLELYKELPVRGNRKQLAEYVKHSEPLMQEDEIKLIERELDKRKSAGDKAAYYEPAAPSIYKHKNPNG
jgi:hypothetical protein